MLLKLPPNGMMTDEQEEAAWEAKESYFKYEPPPTPEHVLRAFGMLPSDDPEMGGFPNG